MNNCSEGKITRKRKEKENNLSISDSQLESLARVLLPAIREYLSSEEGRKDYAEWQANKAETAALQLNKKSKCKNSSADDDGTLLPEITQKQDKKFAELL